MAHIVTCVYCKQRFDRDKFPYVQVSARRYAHQECSLTEEQKLSKEEQDKIDLENYILQLFKIDYIDAKIRKQIKQYREEYNYTYSGIRKALVYFYEVKGNSIEKANGGIGIVPYVYQDAYNYYYHIWMAKQTNEAKPIEQYVPQERVITIPPPKRVDKRKKLFAFLEQEETDSGV